MLLWLALLALIAIGFRRFLVGYPAPPVGVTALAAREYETARAAAEVIYPKGGPIDASGDTAHVAMHSDRFVGAQTRSNRILMALLFIAVEHATLVFPARGPRGWRRFSSLSPDQQLAYLQGWQQSELAPRRLVFMSLRAILTMGYFADAEVLGALGLRPREILSPVLEVDLLWPAVGQHPETIRFTRADVTGPGTSTPLGPSGSVHRDYR